ncbi:unnamed protein product [Durusdinium trenchii]|uniref:Nucleotide-diphospho-sugar transferase domain-containing protein n=2 Tax=Durusdinium trenchii TaxID=1381693 RepID=A0ABP0R6R5_9DINO
MVLGMAWLWILAIGAGTFSGTSAAFEEFFSAERCGQLSFDQNSLPPSEWRELIYEPFIHWSRHGGHIHRTTRDMALLLRNALMRGRGQIEGDAGCFCVFLFAVLVRASSDIAFVGKTLGSSYDVQYAAAHDVMAYFSHMIARTAANPLSSSWPLQHAWLRTLETFRAVAAAQPSEHGIAARCECQEPEGFLTPVLKLLESMEPSNWAVADWTSFLDLDDVRLPPLMQKSCAHETTCSDVQVITHLLCAEHFLLTGDAAKALHKRSRAAAVALFAPHCHRALRAIGSVEDIVYNAALGITEANNKMTSAYLHRALVWRPMPARFVVQPRLVPTHFDAPSAGGSGGGPARLALFATLVNTQDHYKEQNFVLDAMRLKCSADRLGRQLPFHLIYGGGLMESELSLLMRFGFIIEDYSKEVDFIKSKCCKQCDGRRDGWATVFKLFAWKALAYDLVLHVDLDVCFAGRSPAAAMEELKEANVSFLSDPNPSGPGWHSHIFALKPSLEKFKDQSSTALRCTPPEIVDFTMGHPRFYCSEQDRLHDMFDVSFARAGGMSQAVPHQPICEDFPINPYCLEGTPERHQELSWWDCDRFWQHCVDIPTALVSNVGSF